MGLEPLFVTSAGPQWTMRTHGILPQGNWNDSNEGCLLLDDGTFWLTIHRIASVVGLYDGGSQWMGTASPEGCIRWSGDLWGIDGHLGPDNAEGWPDDPTPIWDVIMMGSDDTNEDHMWVHDGKNIYYSVEAVKFGPTGQSLDGTRIYKLDPSTGLTTWVAGAAYPAGTDNNTANRDSHNGKSALIPEANLGLSCVDGDREYVYWLQKFPGGGPSQHGLTIRRMKLTPPYPVDTLPGHNPGKYTTITGEQINPATGIPNRYDSDFIASLTSSIGCDDDFIYLGGHDLRRLSKTGGPIKTYIWNREFTPTGSRDTLTDYEESPNGAPNQETLQLGRPELEGLRIMEGGKLMIKGRKLFFLNEAGVTFISGYNLFGTRFAYFDLDELEATGPQRVNRFSPQWTSIANNSHYFEQGNRYTPQRWASAGGYHWGWRDGGTPLFSNPFRYFDINPHAVGWENRIAFVHAEVSPNITGEGYGNNAKVTHVAAYLEESATASQFELKIRFTGDLLKGYAAARQIKHAKAPTEVQLG